MLAAVRQASPQRASDDRELHHEAPGSKPIQASAPSAAAINAAIAEPIGRAPNAAVVIGADTRPSIAAGVTTWRNAVELTTPRIGPAPIRKSSTKRHRWNPQRQHHDQASD
jgi:hypothetical protein